MKKLLSTILMTLVATAAFAGPIDGKWKAELQGMQRKGKQEGKGPVTAVLNLKSDGAVLTGTVSMGGGKRGKSVDIKDGKLDGDKFSFVIVRTTKKGEVNVAWAGTVSGDEMKGTQSLKGGKRSVEFTAKRQ